MMADDDGGGFGLGLLRWGVVDSEVETGGRDDDGEGLGEVVCSGDGVQVLAKTTPSARWLLFGLRSAPPAGYAIEGTSDMFEGG